MKLTRSFGIIAVALLVWACAPSRGVLIKSSGSNFDRAQRILLSVADEQALTVIFFARVADPPNAFAYRPVAKVVAPNTETNKEGALVYSLEFSDGEHQLALWIPNEQQALKICKALADAHISFEVTKGTGLVPECVSK